MSVEDSAQIGLMRTINVYLNFLLAREIVYLRAFSHLSVWHIEFPISNNYDQLWGDKSLFNKDICKLCLHESSNPGSTNFQSLTEFQSTNGCGLSQSRFQSRSHWRQIQVESGLEPSCERGGAINSIPTFFKKIQSLL